MSEQLRAANIELQKGDLRATIMQEGAWLASLEEAGEPILFPYSSFAGADGTQKVRGGCHVCLPNFGPDASGELAQHGFGRTNSWQVEYQTEAGVTLSLSEKPADYKELAAELQYELKEHGISIQLTAINYGQEALRISPGFHPYFAASNAQEVVVSGQSYDTTELADAVLLPSAVSDLQLPDRTIWVEQANLSKWVLWTDKLGDYVCLEPTQSGPSFQQTEPQEEELLAPGETRSWSLQITTE